MPNFEIQLRDVMLFARHGVLTEERVLGNQYKVNVRLVIPARAFDDKADDIASTVSYADVFDVLKEEMDTPRRLMESVAVSFSRKVRSRWPQVEGGEIELIKIVPPIPGLIGQAAVKYEF